MQVYFSGFELDDNNKLFCEKCNKKQPAVKIPEPAILAEYMIVTINIFHYQGAASFKISKPFTFEFNINFKNILPKIITQDQIY